MGDLTRKRLFVYDRYDPRIMDGERLHIPDLKRYLAKVHSSGGWGKDANETQKDDEFQFYGRSLSVYTREVLGADFNKVYLPLAFTGKVADAIQAAGHEVFASDLSEFWVSRIKSRGLRAETRSFEDIPQERFDAMVCFEPCPVNDNFVGALGILRALSRSIPYVEIDSYPHFGILPIKWRKKAYGPDGMLFFPDGLDSKTYPARPDDALRLAYDYGAGYHRDTVYCDSRNVFEFESALPTPESSRRASIDLMLLERQDEWIGGPWVSISLIADRLGITAGTVAASLNRLACLSMRHCLAEGELYYNGNMNAAKDDPSVIRSVGIME